MLPQREYLPIAGRHDASENIADAHTRLDRIHRHHDRIDEYRRNRDRSSLRAALEAATSTIEWAERLPVIARGVGTFGIRREAMVLRNLARCYLLELGVVA